MIRKLIKRKARQRVRNNLQNRSYTTRTFDRGEALLYEDNSDVLAGNSSAYFPASPLPECLNSVLEFPDDYGTTAPPGTNVGVEAELDFMDFLGVPEAWEYTTGSSEIIVGISDSHVPINHPVVADDRDFLGKTTLFYGDGAPGNHGGHGISVGERAAGQGNNSFGSTGVCQDCQIFATGFGHSSYDDLLEMSYAGAKVINCSWGTIGSSEMRQECINEIYEHGTIVVAATHNVEGSAPPPPDAYRYPAGYNHVISVGGVGHRNEMTVENLSVSDAGTLFIRNIKYQVSGTTCFFGDPSTEPLGNLAHSHHGNATFLNDAVDILAPGARIFSYGPYLLGTGFYTGSGDLKSSASTPLVSGTVALMVDLNHSLSFEEVESILKITSTNIDDFPGNQIVAGVDITGLFGSGSLHTGRAVELVHDLSNPWNVAYLEDQKFTRWDFIFNGVSRDIIIQNQRFTESSTLWVFAKNRITLEEGSVFEPGVQGFAILEIDPDLVIDTDGPLF